MKSWKSKGWGVYIYVEIPLTEDGLPKGIKSLNKDIKVGIGIQWIIGNSKYNNSQYKWLTWYNIYTNIITIERSNYFWLCSNYWLPTIYLYLGHTLYYDIGILNRYRRCTYISIYNYYIRVSNSILVYYIVVGEGRYRSDSKIDTNWIGI